MRGSTGDRGTPQLLEREAELDRIDAALEDAGAGRGALVSIAGPAGIGKTGLIEAVRRRAADSGLAVGSARGTELELELAFGGVRQLLEPLLAALEPTDRASMLAGSAQLAEPVFDPGAFGAGGRVGSDPAFSILHGLYWLCANLAQRDPLVLAVDDGHWLDQASLRFLAYLGQRLEGTQIALVFAARTGSQRGTAEELIGRIAGDPIGVSLTPGPLSETAIAELLAEATDAGPEPEFVAAFRRATGGVPFFARELIEELLERGIGPVGGATGLIAEIGPPTVARSVIERVRRLAAGAEDLARAVAVLGPDAALHRVARMTEIDEAAVAAGVDALAVGGVFRRDGELEFVHPIVRAAVYDAIPPAARSRLHKIGAELLASEGVGEDRVAAHLLATAPAGDPETVATLLRVGRGAAARGAPRSAVACLRRAVAEPPRDAETRCAIVRELGAAEVHSGELERGREHIEEAFGLAEPGRHRALVAQDLSGCLWLLWRHHEAAVVIRTALSQLDAADTELALSLRAELVLLSALEPTVHEPAAGEPEPPGALAGGATLGAAKLEAALAADGALRMTESAAEVRERAATARAGGIVDDLGQGGSLWINAVAPAVLADGFALAEQMVAEAFEAGHARFSVIFSARAYLVRALLRLRQGALADAEADAEATLEAVGDAGFYFALLAISLLVECRAERGELDAAEHTLERAGMLGEIPDSFVHNWILGSRGRLRLDQGRPAEAIADLEELGTRNRRRGQQNPAIHPHRSRLALALLRAGEPARASACAEDEVEAARAWGAASATGSAQRVLGLCAGGKRGIELLRESAALLEASGARLEQAHSLVELGAAIRRSGGRRDAREPLYTGMELAHGCGAGPLVERAREELRATGARPRRVMRTGVDALTPSELRVARLAAEGMTNREIAQALFVTRRTVEGHLTHAFQKLDIDARDGLAERLTAEPAP